jgi:UDPglucose 6-dehydrogenase
MFGIKIIFHTFKIFTKVHTYAWKKKNYIIYSLRYKMKISIAGLGFVGGSMLKSFLLKQKNYNATDLEISGYDKFKNGGIGTVKSLDTADIVFMALPTPFSEELCEYNKTAIFDVCKYLSSVNFKGVVVLKSTVEPEITNYLYDKFKLNFIHNPEFLTARTAYEDFHNQEHIILGKHTMCDSDKFILVRDFYTRLYPNADITECDSIESECMKLTANCFYSVKVQFFNEIYLMCQKNGADYDKVKNMVLKNGWVNPMHTDIPGPDGQLSYGGLCFPKDTNALNKYLEKLDSKNLVLDATIKERNSMRYD